jgi:ubiquinone/menaquinone biosynthesis C-methylase UbiE
MVSDEQLAHLVANEADMAYKRRVMLFLRWLELRPDDRVLDGGCGRGFVLNIARAVSDCRLVGIELDHQVLDVARRNLDDREIRLVNGDLCHLPYADDSFDKAILAEVLEHLEDDRGGLQETVRVTRPGGLIAISAPNADYPFLWDPINKTLEALLGTHIARGPLAGIWANHVRLYTVDQLVELVEGVGLEVEAVRTLVHHAFPFSHNLVYGVGKPLMESGILPPEMDRAASRYSLDGKAGGRLNPIRVGVGVLGLIDRLNDRLDKDNLNLSTVDICVKARVPVGSALH